MLNPRQKSPFPGLSYILVSRYGPASSFNVSLWDFFLFVLLFASLIILKINSTLLFNKTFEVNVCSKNSVGDRGVRY